MLRSMFIAFIAVVVSSGIVLQADDVKKPQPTDKPTVKQIEKKKQPLLRKQVDKTKQPVKQKPSVAILGSDTEYYTNSPAQGRPADGQVKAGTKVRVLEKAGSLKALEKQPDAKAKAALLKKKKAAAGKDAVPDKKTPEEKPATDKQKTNSDKAALKKKAEAEK